jgi:hypothetical protein
MTLINCTECNSQISDEASSCPHCGKPNKPLAKKKKTLKRFFLGFGILFCPYVFSWFTLRKDFSPTYKVIAFSWMLALGAKSAFDEHIHDQFTSLGFSSLNEMQEIQALGWHTKAKYDEDQELIKNIAYMKADEKYWSIKFTSINQYLKFKSDIKDRQVPFNRVAEFLRIGATEWDSLIKKKELQDNLMNAKYLSDNYSQAASFPCQKAVEKLASYSYEWTDGFFETKFNSYSTKTLTPGILIIKGDKIKFQNGFGAWKIMRYQCAFDVQTGEVIDASAQ